MIGFSRFLLVILLLTVVAMTSAVVTMHFAIHGAEVAVPDFRGLTLTDAGERAASAGLRLHVENHLYSADVPAGRIANQSPAPGTIVRGGWRVWLTQSLGPQKLAIPDLVGKDQRVATIEIRRTGLQAGSQAELYQPDAQPGSVIAQSPVAGASGIAAPVVNLLVAAPPESASLSGGFVMPDLIGKNFTASALMLTHAGLQMAPLKTQEIEVAPAAPASTAGAAPGEPPAATPAPSALAPAPPAAPGTIVAQDPPAGFRVDGGTPIQLTVAQ